MRLIILAAVRSAAICTTLFVVAVSSALGVTIEWTDVGNPGNAPRPNLGAMWGAVPYSYKISTYPVTNSQYVEFLNAKDPSGTNSLGLYSTIMPLSGGIAYDASAAVGSKYATIPSNANWPVNHVSWNDAIRFVNWLSNGQGNGDTETGSYTIASGIGGSATQRNPGAKIFLPSRDEWVKAGYYDPATGTYFDYATSSNTYPTASLPTSTPNSANIGAVVGHPTDVGAYSGTKSPYGAFDMVGNVWQWVEESPGPGSNRRVRGGSYNSAATILSSLYPGLSDDVQIGFRLAMVPEPSSVALALIGSVGVVAWGLRRRRA